MEILKNNAVCSICGKEYYMCKSCKDMVALKPYKLHTDTAEHFKVYQVIRGYNTGVYTIEEAQAKLQAIDLSDMKYFRENIKSIIKTILSYNKVSKTKVTEKQDVVNVDSVSKKTTKKKSKNPVET